MNPESPSPRAAPRQAPAAATPVMMNATNEKLPSPGSLAAIMNSGDVPRTSEIDRLPPMTTGPSMQEQGKRQDTSMLRALDRRCLLN
jgi:hypothetical protein